MQIEYECHLILKFELDTYYDSSLQTYEVQSRLKIPITYLLNFLRFYKKEIKKKKKEICDFHQLLLE